MKKFDKVQYKKLKKAYNLAVKAEKVSFFFKGEEYLMLYAKYLLEYLEGRFEG